MCVDELVGGPSFFAILDPRGGRGEGQPNVSHTFSPSASGCRRIFVGLLGISELMVIVRSLRGSVGVIVTRVVRQVVNPASARPTRQAC